MHRDDERAIGIIGLVCCVLGSAIGYASQGTTKSIHVGAMAGSVVGLVVSIGYFVMRPTPPVIARTPAERLP